MFGRITQFRSHLHYGFITKVDGSDVFFHETGYLGEIADIQIGQRVVFEEIPYQWRSKESRKAINILPAPPATPREILSTSHAPTSYGWNISPADLVVPSKPAQTAPGTTIESTIAAAKVLTAPSKAVLA
jgi:cold shock CspA family protein